MDAGSSSEKGRDFSSSGFIEIYDTTLRDGSQSSLVSFSLQDKLDIARTLTENGFDFIEAGWPGANPKDMELFRKLKGLAGRLVAFGSTHRPGVRPRKDTNLRGLLDSCAGNITIFGKAWDMHVTQVLGTTLDNNLKMIRNSIRFMVSKGRNVIFDAEHFFDGYKANPGHALEVVGAAAGAGAKRIVLCDTNGGTLPNEIYDIVKGARKKLPRDIILGIHCHNDSGTAVASSLEAVRAGATHVQGTINGIGERTGNADLCTIIPNLVLKMNAKVSVPLDKLRMISLYVSELLNMEENPMQPYIGRLAFSHKGGIHVDAMLKNPLTYEHVNPETVGNARHMMVSEQSGRATVVSKGKELGFILNKKDPETGEILRRIKALETTGLRLGNADASLWLLFSGVLGKRKDFFDITEWKTTVSRENGHVDSLAKVTVRINGSGMLEQEITEGVGPVDAQDLALRKALSKHYPEIVNVRLVNFKVTVINQEGTASAVEVFIEFTDGNREWATANASENILEASKNALIEGYRYYLNTTRLSR